jgi:hypothetical protein
MITKYDTWPQTDFYTGGGKYHARWNLGQLIKVILLLSILSTNGRLILLSNVKGCLYSGYERKYSYSWKI